VDGTVYPIKPGTLYALDRHEMHFLMADPENDMRLVCVFSPPLQGDERHSFDSDQFSQY
jgi:L-ectoine synthase